jgi:hypothetical protein
MNPHLRLFFHTVARDEAARGKYLAENLNAGDRVRDAWRKACPETEDSDGRRQAGVRFIGARKQEAGGVAGLLRSCG